MITPDQFATIANTLKLDKQAEYLAALNATLEEFEINTVFRQAAFISQTSHESMGFTRLAESLNYSALRLTLVWPKRFPNVAVAAPYAHNEEKLGNFTYANRNGNGPVESGDGFKYRGRGFIQITGRANYEACGEGLGLELLADPDLLLQPVNAFRSAGWYWDKHGLNALADLEKIRAITVAINGGTVGLDERVKLYGKIKAVLAG